MYVCIYIYVYITLLLICLLLLVVVVVALVIGVSYIHIYIYIYSAGTSVIGWSNNDFDNLPFGSEVEANEIATCAADSSLMVCASLNRRLLK